MKDDSNEALPSIDSKLCIKVLGGSIRNLAKNALSLLNHFGVNPTEIVRQKVLDAYGRDGIRCEIAAQGIAMHLVKADANQPLLYIANRWIEAAQLISIRWNDPKIDRTEVVNPEIQNLLTLIKKTEQWAIFQTEVKRSKSRKKGGPRNLVTTKPLERIRYSKEHRAWILQLPGEQHRFKSEADAVAAGCRIFGCRPEDVEPLRSIGYRQELPRDSVWSGEWNQIKKNP